MAENGTEAQITKTPLHNNGGSSGSSSGRKKKSSYYRPTAERLRIILMFLMCINLFGFPTPVGEYVKFACGFVPIAFFMLSGYLVLRESHHRSERILRSVKRCAIVFAVLSVVYFGINFLYYKIVHGANILPILKYGEFWFDFLVFNEWQFNIGSTIWYVQSLLYAYIIIYFIDKFKLLKYDWIISIVLISFTVISGELSGVFRWNIAGYTYLPGNFLTRALPYTLLGCFIHKKKHRLIETREVVIWLCMIGGVLLMFGEVYFLAALKVPGYYGHLIGMPIVAASVLVLAICSKSPKKGFEAKLGMSRWHVNCIYYLCQPVSTIVIIIITYLLVNVDLTLYSRAIEYIGLITFAVCFGISWLISYGYRKILKKKKHVHSN